MVWCRTCCRLVSKDYSVFSDPLIHLELHAEITTLVRLDQFTEYRDRWGDASFRMPAYEKWGSHTTISVTPGQFGLVSVIHPKPVAPSPAISHRILIFIRADVLRAPGN